jgi:CRISPR/Cas system CSM-associated protein Csm5 (group 7 of RAMP superfamily)
MMALNPIYSGQTLPLEEINVMLDSLKNDHEPLLKESISEWQGLGAFEKDPEITATVKKFLSKNYVYFTGKTFLENELLELNRICNECWILINRYLFMEFKGIVEKQLRLSGN